jgi:hypothetical protein
MIDLSANAHAKRGRPVTLFAFYEGTDALFQGEGVCFNSDKGTATDADGNRCNFVERPTASNNKEFAGVAARNYSARDLPQLVELYAPGSKCVPVALGGVDTTIGTGLLTFTVAGKYNVGVTQGLATEAGRFYTGKFGGRGSAIPRQTTSLLVESGLTGAWSLATDGVTLTVASTTGLAAGDTVVLLGGEDDGTGCVIPGKYTISSITSATVLVLTSSAVDATPGSAASCTGYAYTGNPTALCDLLDGEESGGLEFLSFPNAGGDDQPHMAGGVSYVCGGITLAADADVELAQGTRIGEKKAFHVLGTLTTSDFVVDLVTAGIQIDGSTALAEFVAGDAAGEFCVMEFRGARWFALDISGMTQA